MTEFIFYHDLNYRLYVKMGRWVFVRVEKTDYRCK